jgi:hypothetical protein
MSDFKLLSGGNPYIVNEIPNHIASWLYVTVEDFDSENVLIGEIECDGIIEFLSRFNDNEIVPVISITGPNELEHNFYTQGFGWGFNIQRDRIKIKWIHRIND